MEDIAVEEDIRDELPEEKVFPDNNGNKAEYKEHLFPGKMLEDKCRSAGNHNGFYYRSKGTAKRDMRGNMVAHDLDKISARKIRKTA